MTKPMSDFKHILIIAENNADADRIRRENHYNASRILRWPVGVDVANTLVCVSERLAFCTTDQDGVLEEIPAAAYVVVL